MNFNALHSSYTNCRALSISTIRKYLFGVFVLESHFMGVVRQPCGASDIHHFRIELKGMVSHTFCSLSRLRIFMAK